MGRATLQKRTSPWRSRGGTRSPGRQDTPAKRGQGGGCCEGQGPRPRKKKKAAAAKHEESGEVSGARRHPLGSGSALKPWRSRYYARATSPSSEGRRPDRKYLKTGSRTGHRRIHIERKPGKVTVHRCTRAAGRGHRQARRGVDKLRTSGQSTGKEWAQRRGIKRPGSSPVVAGSVAHQLTQRISFRRAMKRACRRPADGGGRGSDQDGGSPGRRRDRGTRGTRGAVPLHTLADIDYGTSTAMTTTAHRVNYGSSRAR